MMNGFHGSITGEESPFMHTSVEIAEAARGNQADRRPMTKAALDFC